MKAILASLIAFCALSGLAFEGTAAHGGSDHSKSAKLPHYRVRGTPNGNILIADKSKDPPVFSGFVWELLNQLTTVANFTFTLTLQKDEIYGSPDKDGNWNGMVLELMKNNTDIVAGDLSITTPRLQVIDFTVPYSLYNLVVLVQKGAKMDGIKYVVRNTADATFLETSTDSTVKNIWANIAKDKANQIVTSDEDGVAKVNSGGYAFVSQSITLQPFIKQSKGKLMTTGKILESAYYSLGVQLGSDLRRILSIGVTKLQETGQLQQLIDKWLT